MGRYSKYARKYVKKWEEEAWAKGWLTEYRKTDNYNVNDINEAYCKYCHTSLRAHASDLKKHANTPSHKLKANSVRISQNNRNTLTHYGIGTSANSIRNQKKFDLQLAMYIACHATLRSIDHLCDILKKTGERQDCDIMKNLRLHRTKCASLIQNVISPAFLVDIVNQIGNKRYSLIIDESTDVSINKYMAVCVRYFNECSFEIITDFLGLIEIERATANDLYESLKLFLHKINLPLHNLLSIGTDGANNLCGDKHSVYSLLKSDVPDLRLVKCTCHSLALCVSHSSELLPEELEFITQEVYNWFSKSSLRRIEYKKVFDLINLGEEKTFKNFVQLCQTRWLSRYEVVARILDHWLELKTFFSMVQEKCVKVNLLKNYLCEKNRLYFIFLKPILFEMNQLNLRFQKNSCDIGAAYNDLFMSIQSLAKRIIKPIFLNMDYGSEKNLLIKIKAACQNSLAFLKPDDCDLGCEFHSAFSSLHFDINERKEILECCFNFLKKLLCELIKRLPSNIDTYQKMRMLNPYACAVTSSKDQFLDLPIISFILPGENQSQIENQWRKLPEVSWSSVFKSEIPKNLSEFWCKVYKFETESSEPFFLEIVTVVLRMLSLPTSNAVVERVFSIMNIVKTKIKNRMKLHMLEAVIRVKVYLCNRNKCCTNLEISEKMLELFNSSIMYCKEDENTNEINLAFELCDE